MQSGAAVPYVRADGGKAVTSEGGIQLLVPPSHPHPDSLLATANAHRKTRQLHNLMLTQAKANKHLS